MTIASHHVRELAAVVRTIPVVELLAFANEFGLLLFQSSYGWAADSIKLWVSLWDPARVRQSRNTVATGLGRWAVCEHAC